MEIFGGILSTVICSLATGFLAWFFGRKKQRSEELQAAVSSWNDMKSSLQDDIKDLLEQHQKDKETILALTDEIEELNKKVLTLQEQISLLQHDVCRDQIINKKSKAKKHETERSDCKTQKK